jgi:fumarylacetoacetase
LNNFAALPKEVRFAVRKAVQDAWKSGELYEKFGGALVPASVVTNHLPMETQNYTDFVSSRGHFENLSSTKIFFFTALNCEQIQNFVGTPEARRNPFYHMPTGYYGNSRGIVVSGTPIPRFQGLIAGQFQREVAATSGPSEQFDFELELGIYISKPSERGKAISIANVDDHVFGFVLLNDWSGK